MLRAWRAGARRADMPGLKSWLFSPGVPGPCCILACRARVIWGGVAVGRCRVAAVVAALLCTISGCGVAKEGAHARGREREQPMLWLLGGVLSCGSIGPVSRPLRSLIWQSGVRPVACLGKRAAPARGVAALAAELCLFPCHARGAGVCEPPQPRPPQGSVGGAAVI